MNKNRLGPMTRVVPASRHKVKLGPTRPAKPNPTTRTSPGPIDVSSHSPMNKSRHCSRPCLPLSQNHSFQMKGTSVPYDSPVTVLRTRNADHNNLQRWCKSCCPGLLQRLMRGRFPLLKCQMVERSCRHTTCSVAEAPTQKNLLGIRILRIG